MNQTERTPDEMTRFMQFFHNCVAHPLEGWCVLILGRSPAWCGRLHDWTAALAWPSDAEARLVPPAPALPPLTGQHVWIGWASDDNDWHSFRVLHVGDGLVQLQGLPDEAAYTGGPFWAPLSTIRAIAPWSGRGAWERREYPLYEAIRRPSGGATEIR